MNINAANWDADAPPRLITRTCPECGKQWGESDDQCSDKCPDGHLQEVSSEDE